MDLGPTLIGELIELRPLRADDFEALYAVAADPLIWEQLPQRNRYQRDVFKKLFDSWIAEPGTLIVIERASGKAIGSSRFYELKERTAAIGYTFLSRAHWGHTFNKELKRLMLDHAFKSVESVLFYIAESNVRSQMAIQKIGAKLVERSVKQVDGVEAPYLAFEIRKFGRN